MPAAGKQSGSTPKRPAPAVSDRGQGVVHAAGQPARAAVQQSASTLGRGVVPAVPDFQQIVARAAKQPVQAAGRKSARDPSQRIVPAVPLTPRDEKYRAGVEIEVLLSTHSKLVGKTFDNFGLGFRSETESFSHFGSAVSEMYNDGLATSKRKPIEMTYAGGNTVWDYKTWFLHIDPTVEKTHDLRLNKSESTGYR